MENPWDILSEVHDKLSRQRERRDRLESTSSKDCHDSNGKPSRLYQLGKWGALAAIAYFLWMEHRAHVIAILPYLILLACPLMHFFMHGKHGPRNHGPQTENKETKQ